MSAQGRQKGLEEARRRFGTAEATINPRTREWTLQQLIEDPKNVARAKGDFICYSNPSARRALADLASAVDALDDGGDAA